MLPITAFTETAGTFVSMEGRVQSFHATVNTPGDSRIWVRLERTDEGSMLVVEDDGPGVAPGDRERIFETFRQGPGAGPGSGVGLALVALFAELHDGRAWVQ